MAEKRPSPAPGPDRAKPVTSVTVVIFGDEGCSHWVKIEGGLDPLHAMMLAVHALLDRLMRRIR